MPDPDVSDATAGDLGAIDFDPFGVAASSAPPAGDKPPAEPRPTAVEWPSYDAPAGTEPPLGDPAEAPHGTAVALTVEGLLDDLERVARERDGYLDDSRRLAAEFANFRRQTERRQIEMDERAGSRLAEELLPVLDACDGARAHGRTDVEPVHVMLVQALEKLGMSVLDPIDQPFDPNCHEAVLHEDGDGGGPVVSEVLRTGYLWHGRVLRPALVKVRG